MSSGFLYAGLLAFLLVPVIVTGGYATAGSGPGMSPGLAGGSPGISDRSLPLFPNVSFPEQTLAAQDWYEQGFTLTNEERYSEAIQAYEMALSYNRSLLNAWYYSGDALFRLGQYSESLLAFGNATSVDPDFVDAYFYESLVYEKLGRYQDEKDALRRGLEAADRRKAKETVIAPAGSPGTIPLPVSSGTAALGSGIAASLRTILRRKKRE